MNRLAVRLFIAAALFQSCNGNFIPPLFQSLEVLQEKQLFKREMERALNEFPTSSPTESQAPSPSPSKTPTSKPTETPSPTKSPTSSPTESFAPSPSPSKTPTLKPSSSPSELPSVSPTDSPSSSPSKSPSSKPSSAPSVSSQPSTMPSSKPTSTLMPSKAPTGKPSTRPSSTPTLSNAPTSRPTITSELEAEFEIVWAMNRELNTEEVSIVEASCKKMVEKEANLEDRKLSGISCGVSSQDLSTRRNLAIKSRSSDRILSSTNIIGVKVRAQYSGSEKNYDLYQAFRDVFDGYSETFIDVCIEQWTTEYGSNVDNIFKDIKSGTDGSTNAVLGQNSNGLVAGGSSSSGLSGGAYVGVILTAIAAVGLAIAASVYSIRQHRLEKNPPIHEENYGDMPEIFALDSEETSDASSPRNGALLIGNIRSSTGAVSYGNRKHSLLNEVDEDGNLVSGCAFNAYQAYQFRTSDVPILKEQQKQPKKKTPKKDQNIIRRMSPSPQKRPSSRRMSSRPSLPSHSPPRKRDPSPQQVRMTSPSPHRIVLMSSPSPHRQPVVLMASPSPQQTPMMTENTSSQPISNVAPSLPLQADKAKSIEQHPAELLRDFSSGNTAPIANVVNRNRALYEPSEISEVTTEDMHLASPIQFGRTGSCRSSLVSVKDRISTFEKLSDANSGKSGSQTASQAASILLSRIGTQSVSYIGGSDISSHAKAFFNKMVGRPEAEPPQQNQEPVSTEQHLHAQRKHYQSQAQVHTHREAGQVQGIESLEDDPGHYVVLAPSGPIGIVVDTSQYGPTVHSLKSTSPMIGLISPGDAIVGLDDQDTRGMNAATLTRLMAQKSSQETRKITLLTME